MVAWDRASPARVPLTGTEHSAIVDMDMDLHRGTQVVRIRIWTDIRISGTPGSI